MAYRDGRPPPVPPIKFCNIPVLGVDVSPAGFMAHTLAKEEHPDPASSSTC